MAIPRPTGFGARAPLFFWVVLILGLGGSLELSGQGGMNPEKMVSSGVGIVSGGGLHAFESQLVTSSFVENGQLLLRQGPWFEGDVVPLPAAQLNPENIQVQVTSSGGLTIVYRAPDPVTMSPEIFSHSSLQGLPLTSVNVSSNAFPDYTPRLSFRRGLGARYIVWEMIDSSSISQVVLSSNLRTGVPIAEGEAPALALGPDGTIHLLYTRLGELIYRAENSGILGPESVIDSSLSMGDLNIEIGAGGFVHLLYSRNGDLVSTVGDGTGAFSPAVTVVDEFDDPSNPVLLLRSPFNPAALYLREGEVMRRILSPTGISAEENLTMTPAVDEVSFSASMDPNGFTHLQYLRDQDLFYRNDAPPPEAAFTASSVSGEPPFEVQFTDQSGGFVSEWLWDFGDGVQSTDSSPIHQYEAAGLYTVSLQVGGAGEADELVIVDYIEVLEPQNKVWVPDLQVLQGQPGLQIPVLCNHVDPLQGYQLALGWDLDGIEVQEALLTDTIVSNLNPEFVSFSYFDEPDRGFLTLGLVIDTQPPFDGRTLAPGNSHRVLNLAIEVQPSAVPGTELEIGPVPSYGSPPISNVFTVEGQSVLPWIGSGTMTILEMTIPPPLLFIRGDLDLSFSLNLTDCISLLSFLFNGGVEPLCFDAADLNDSGTIDVSDPIYLLNFLFIGGNPPAFPYPGPGLDPSVDNLGDC